MSPQTSRLRVNCERVVTSHYRLHCSQISYAFFDPGGPVVIILATGSEIRGFKPGRGRWIFFSERKNPEYNFLWKGM